jgi:hypothetical protein
MAPLNLTNESSAITDEAKDPPMMTVRIDANTLFFITSFPFLYFPFILFSFILGSPVTAGTFSCLRSLLISVLLSGVPAGLGEQRMPGV